jgi:hypothetical protein
MSSSFWVALIWHVKRYFYCKMQASSSKIVHPCHLVICSCCSTYLRHLSLITLSHPFRTFILPLKTTSPFGKIQMPPPLSMTTSGRARNIEGIVIGVIILPFPGLGAIILLSNWSSTQWKGLPNYYRPFFWVHFHDFLNMALASIGKRRQYVNYKHLYYIF